MQGLCSKGGEKRRDLAEGKTKKGVPKNALSRLSLLIRA